MSTIAVVILILVIVAVAALLFYMWRQERSKKLIRHFGPEYEQAVQEYGSRDKAEQSLVTRQKRMEKMRIQPLSAPERDHFAQEWLRTQATFVDDPAGSINQADRLVCDAMRARGYPMADFDRRTEDLSVDHPQVVKNYRAAHDIAERSSRNEASTEDLRLAMVYYRDLFDELLETHVTSPRR